MSCAYDHADFGQHVAKYLYTQGTVLNPEADQMAGNLPAVFLGGWDDKPDRAINIVGPWQNNDDSETNPVVRFMVAVRSDPWDMNQLIDDSQNIFQALHHPDHPLQLTAQQEVMYCKRVISDPLAQDQNRRWIRVDTYTARLQPPTT